MGFQKFEFLLKHNCSTTEYNALALLQKYDSKL